MRSLNCDHPLKARGSPAPGKGAASRDTQWASGRGLETRDLEKMGKVGTPAQVGKAVADLPGVPKEQKPWRGGAAWLEGSAPTAQAPPPVVAVSGDGAVRAARVASHHRSRGTTAHLQRQRSQVQAGV